RPAGAPADRVAFVRRAAGTPSLPRRNPQPMTSPFPEQKMPPWRRAVLKVGSSLLTDGKGGLGKRNAAALAGMIARLRDQGREVLLVSSGAVAAGRGLLAGSGAEL